MGNDKKDKLVIELYGNQELIAKKALGKNIFVSDMKVSEERVFIIERSLGSRKQLENFFFKSFKWDGRKIKQSWSVRAKDSGGGRDWNQSITFTGWWYISGWIF